MHDPSGGQAAEQLTLSGAGQERAEREGAARPSLTESHYRAIFDSAHDFAIYTTDLHGVITSWNPGAEKLLGWCEAEALGEYACMIFIPEDQAQEACDLEMRTADQCGRAEDERWHRRKDGSRFWGSGLMMPFEDAQTEQQIGYLKVLRDRTQEHDAKKRLGASEARYRQIVEGAEDFAIIALDDHGVITSWNSGAERITGYAASEAVGQPSALIFTPEDRAAGSPDQEISRARTDGRAPNERWHEKKDGTRFWGSGLTMQFDQPGGGYLKIFRDRTLEAQTENQLRASEEFNRRVLASSPDCIKVLDLDGRLEFMSEGGMCIMEVDDFSAINGACWTDFWKGEEHSRALAAIEKARHGGSARFQGFATTMKGSPRWWDVAVTPISGSGGKPEKLLSVSRDISAIKQSEEALRESEARVRAITDNLPAGMVFQLATGADGRERRFLHVSQSHEKLTGVAAEAVMADPTIPYDLIVPEDRQQLVRAEVEAIREKRPFDSEVRFRRVDGEVRWCRIISAPREQADGSLIWDGIQIDTTDQKAVEARLRELNETLEARVAQRSAELEQAHEQLRQSQKIEAMGQLTGGVSHDFNNLLSPIIGALDLLQRKEIGGEREKRLIDGALQSAERARVLVQRLLAFARRQPLQTKAVDISALVCGITDLVASTSGPQIKVQVEVDDNLPPATADPNQVEMAILNLAVNARDAMPEGGTLRISADVQTVDFDNRAGLSPGRYVRLSVADTGAGMDEATLKRAIEPFFSTKGIGKGTGLGLSMVHGLAAQLGGALFILSKPGLGTNVEIWLPASEAQVRELSAAEEVGVSGSAAGTALLVDDEEFVRVSTADMLTDLGYKVVQARSAEEALKAINDGLSPDLLVTDHLMPGMTGAELARELRARSPELPILLVSGYVEAEDIVTDLTRLIKPFKQADLAAKLSELEDS